MYETEPARIEKVEQSRAFFPITGQENRDWPQKFKWKELKSSLNKSSLTMHCTAHHGPITVICEGQTFPALTSHLLTADGQTRSVDIQALI